MQSRLVIGERMSSENKNGGKTVGDHKYNTCETQVLIGAVQMPQYLGKVHGGSTGVWEMVLLISLVRSFY